MYIVQEWGPVILCFVIEKPTQKYLNNFNVFCIYAVCCSVRRNNNKKNKKKLCVSTTLAIA